jgi:hypothetical protein
MKLATKGAESAKTPDHFVPYASSVAILRFEQSRNTNNPGRPNSGALGIVV